MILRDTFLSVKDFSAVLTPFSLPVQLQKN